MRVETLAHFNRPEHLEEDAARTVEQLKKRLSRTKRVAAAVGVAVILVVKLAWPWLQIVGWPAATPWWVAGGLGGLGGSVVLSSSLRHASQLCRIGNWWPSDGPHGPWHGRFGAVFVWYSTQLLACMLVSVPAVVWLAARGAHVLAGGVALLLLLKGEEWYVTRRAHQEMCSNELWSGVTGIRDASVPPEFFEGTPPEVVTTMMRRKTLDAL